MKSFFKEYGFVILAAIVVILLIAMTTPIGDLVKNQTTGIVDSFANKTNTKLNAVNIGDNTAKLAYEGEKLMLNVSSNNSTDTFTAFATYTSKGKEITDEALDIVSKSAGKYEVVLANDADRNTDIQIKVINDGTQEEFYSNVLLIGTAGSSGEGTDTKNYISKDKSYIGKYADLDGDGTPEGIIFADLAFSKSGTWNTYNTSSLTFNKLGTYSYSAVSDLKDYTISEEKYNGTFGEAEIISVVNSSTGNDRFYIMALEDISSNTYIWYDSARSTKISDYATITSDDFGTGKQNTTNMIEAWNASKYGSQNANDKYKDLWGAMQTQANGGWFVPSSGEWNAFATAFNITSDFDGNSNLVGGGNYNSTYGLYYYYWSSSVREYVTAFTADFYHGRPGWVDVNYSNRHHVRLAKTF